MNQDGGAAPRRPAGVVVAIIVVLVLAFLLGYWGKLSVNRPSGWLASSWLPYVLGAWEVVRTEDRPVRAGCLAGVAMLGMYWAVEIGLGLRFSPIDWSAPIDAALLLAAAAVGVGATALTLLRNRIGSKVDAIAAASLATALGVLAAAVLLGSYDPAGSAAVLLGACSVLALSWRDLRKHARVSLAVVVLTAFVALLASNAASYLTT